MLLADEPPVPWSGPLFAPAPPVRNPCAQGTRYVQLSPSHYLCAPTEAASSSRSPLLLAGAALLALLVLGRSRA
jgi:hypothetical protein